MNIDTMIFELQNPEVFGSKHLFATITVFLLIAILLVFLLKVAKHVRHRRVLQVATIFLILLELLKYTHALVTDGSFPLIYIPMQLCSFSLYLMPLVSFGNEKLSRKVMPISYSIGMMAGLIVLFYPATVLGGAYSWLPLSENLIPLISFLYHGTMVFFSMYLVMSKQYRPTFKDYGKVYFALLLFASMAVVTNLIFDTDMMFLNTANGSPLQFILTEYGRVPYMAAMLVLAAIILALPVLPFAFSRKEAYAKQSVSKIGS
ncbi:MAG: YwaF family protein [Candidatus Izemoplasmatales bacterium]|nr:YwaF family protein [Candidatus Izemoplasmatales bacterium]